MNFTKKLLSVITICALLIPNVVFAEGSDSPASETQVVSPHFVLMGEQGNPPAPEKTEEPSTPQDPENPQDPEKPQDPVEPQPPKERTEQIAPITDEEIKFFEFVAEKFGERAEEIQLSGNEGFEPMDADRFNELYGVYMGPLLQYEHPELFYAFTNYLINSTKNNGNITYTIEPTYAMPEDWAAFLSSIREKGEDETDEDYDEYYISTLEEFKKDAVVKSHIDEAEEDIAEEVSKIASEARGLDDLQAVLYVHDYIVSNYEYDTRVSDPEHMGEENRTLYEMVREKRGVCQGYTYLFMAVMRELGIECVSVPTDVLAHIWNKVKIDGEWYNIDLTYDDPVSDISSAISHEYFLLTDDEIKDIDPSVINGEFYKVEGQNAEKLENCALQINPDDTVTITSGEETVVENGEVIDYPYEFENQMGWKLVLKEEEQVALYKVAESSHHYTWNDTAWNGKPVETSESTAFSASPLHKMIGRTAYDGSDFYCVDEDNNICRVDFNEEGQSLTPVYTDSSDYKWFLRGEEHRYYTRPKEDNDHFPLYSSTLESYGGKILFNSPNTVFEFNPANNELAPIYVYNDENPDKADVSNTYFYGLRVKDDKLYAEYSENAKDPVTLIEIPVQIDDPVDEPVIEEKPDGSVKVTVDIPESISEEATVYIAEYDDDGVLIRVISPAEDSEGVTEFEPDIHTKTVKAFIWDNDNAPITNFADHKISKVTVKAENLDDNRSDITEGQLYFFPEGSTAAATKYDIDADAEWYVNGVKVTAVPESLQEIYPSVAAYAYNSFVSGRYSTITMRKTDGNSKYNKIMIEAHSTAIVAEYLESTQKIAFNDAGFDNMLMSLQGKTYSFTLNGKSIDPSELLENDVLTIVYDEVSGFADSDFYYVEVSRDEPHKATCTAVSEYGEFTFDDEVYTAADGMNLYIEPETDYKLYLDVYGRIAMAEEIVYPKNLAILKTVYKQPGGDYKAKIIDKTGAEHEYPIDEADVPRIQEAFPEVDTTTGSGFAEPMDGADALRKAANQVIEYAVKTSGKLTIKSFIGSNYTYTEMEEYKESSNKIGSVSILEDSVILDISDLYDGGEVYAVTPDKLVDGQVYTVYGYDKTVSGTRGYRFILITNGMLSYTSGSQLAVFLEWGKDGDGNDTMKVLADGEEKTETLSENLMPEGLKNGDAIVYMTHYVTHNVINFMRVFNTSGLIADNNTFADFRANVICTPSETVQNGGLINEMFFQTNDSNSILTDGKADAEIVAGIVTKKGQGGSNSLGTLSISPVRRDAGGAYIDLGDVYVNYEDINVSQNAHIYTYTYAADPRGNHRFSTDSEFDDIWAVTPPPSEIVTDEQSHHEKYYIENSEYKDDIQFVFVRIVNDEIEDIYRIIYE